MIQLKGKLKRIDSGMSRDDFAVFCGENVRQRYVQTGRHGGMMDANGEFRPLYQWDHWLWRDIQVFRAQAFVVRPEHVEEVVATLCMVGITYPVRAVPSSAFGVIMEALNLEPHRAIVYPHAPDPHRVAVAWGTRTSANVVPCGTIMALETNKCWFVYPTNIRHVNWQLSRKEIRHG